VDKKKRSQDPQDGEGTHTRELRTAPNQSQSYVEGRLRTREAGLVSDDPRHGRKRGKHRR